MNDTFGAILGVTTTEHYGRSDRMKKLIFAMLTCGLAGLAFAEDKIGDRTIAVDKAPMETRDNGDIAIQAGETTYVFQEGDKESANEFAVTAAALNKGLELRRKREQLKDDLGLGELERLTVSTSGPRYEDIKMYRGANTDQLFSLLENHSFKMSWRLIARTIGIVADEEAAKRLASYASSPFPLDDSATRQYHIAAREGAAWGLMLATQNQPMPWVREYLLAHSDIDQWVQNFGDTEIDRDLAHRMAKNTINAIARMRDSNSVAMLEEVRERHLLKSPVQSLSKESDSIAEPDRELDFIEGTIDVTQQVIKQKEKRKHSH